MSTMKNFTSAEAAPEHLREYARKVERLAQTVIDTVIDSGECNVSVILDVLLTVYVNTGTCFGRELECANRMVQIGGQMLLRDALVQQAAAGESDAPAAPVVR
jgi:hypothetical protein